jgi:hypothetical protein
MKSFISALSLLPLALAAPLLEQRDGSAIPGKYFVILKPEAGPAPNIMGDLAGGLIAGVQRTSTYSIGSTFNGFAASLSDDQVAALQKDSRVHLPRNFSSVLC